jgi:hypothetical protein
MANRKYHEGLSQAYNHKAHEHVALMNAHAQNNNMDSARTHQQLARENFQQSHWHEGEAEISRGPSDDITGELLGNPYMSGRDPYQYALDIQPGGAGWGRVQAEEGTPRPYGSR